MLMQCVEKGEAARVRDLVEHTSVDVNGTTPDGRTALIEAFASGPYVQL